jgi:hypothetical protein
MNRKFLAGGRMDLAALIYFALRFLHEDDYVLATADFGGDAGKEHLL